MTDATSPGIWIVTDDSGKGGGSHKATEFDVSRRSRRAGATAIRCTHRWRASAGYESGERRFLHRFRLTLIGTRKPTAAQRVAVSKLSWPIRTLP